MRADVDARRLGFRHIHIAGVDALGIAARVSRDAVAKLVVARGQVHAQVEHVLAADRRDHIADLDIPIIDGEVETGKESGLPDEPGGEAVRDFGRSEEHTSELQSLMRTSYAVFCLKKKKYK